jgi:hypothetical protein
MCVCMCECIYVHTFVRMYECMHVVCAYTRTCDVCGCVCVCVGVHVFNVCVEVYCPSKTQVCYQRYEDWSQPRGKLG